MIGVGLSSIQSITPYCEAMARGIRDVAVRVAKAVARVFTAVAHLIIAGGTLIKDWVILPICDRVKYSLECIERFFDDLEDEPADYNLRRVHQQGVDVHSGNRDRQTRAAIDLLRAHQGFIPTDRINEAKDQFVKYLYNVRMNQNQKQLAIRALLIPQERGESWGPLLDGNTCYGISGNELIGRLYIFASSLSGKEITNAKMSMIGALSRSYDSFGDRICNDGKTERQVVSVLQGRLKGVNIDDARIQVTKQQAMRMFFYRPENSNPNISLHDLRQAANHFCDENAGVNRAEFIEEIRTYARNSGIV